MASELHIQCIFFDKAHRQKIQHHAIVVDPEELSAGMQVSLFLMIAQKQHRNTCRMGHCPHCPGAILIKSAWRVNIPVATAQQTTEKIAELEHDPSNKTEFMVPELCLSQYIDPSSEQDMICVLFEATFDRTDESFNRHPLLKRKTEDDKGEEEEDDDGEKAKRPKQEIRQQKGLHVRRSPDPSAPINILPPSCTFASYIEMTGVVFVDKTRFISTINGLLDEHNGCIVVLPPGTGKTTMMSMLTAWYDCQLDGDPNGDRHTEMFANLEIDNEVRRRCAKNFSLDSETIWSRRQCFCLVFDLRKVEKSRTADGIFRSLNKYLCKTMTDFVAKYQEKLGELEFSGEELGSAVKMVKKIFDHVASHKIKGRRLFVGADHWDKFILETLTLHAAAGTATERIIANMIVFLTQLTDPGRKGRRVKLLVLGNLPPFGAMGAMENISLLECMDGAFGMNSQELRGFFTILSQGRRRKLTPNGAGMWGRLGCFTPPEIHSDDRSPERVYNFNLVLYHVASTLNLDNAHRTLADSPMLIAISKLCETLLKYSSLRRERQLTISPILNVTSPSLVGFTKNEQVLWQLLFYLGALKVSDPGREPDQMWTVEVSSTFAAHQLFSRYPPIPHDEIQAEAPLEIQLRALLERDPSALIKAISDYLSDKPLMDLYKMGEAVFQTMFDVHMANGSRQVNNYFAQIGLHTDPTKTGDEQDYSAGQGAYGYIDIFLCGLSDLRPGRVVAIELKYISLHGLFRAMHDTDTGCHNAVGKKFREPCLLKIEELEKMSIAKLRQMHYHFYSKGGEPNTVTLGIHLDDAVAQLQSYMSAIVDGQARDQIKKGISTYEKRIKVVTAGSTRVVDEVIGFVVCGIGRRIITITVEPRTQNTQYQFSAMPSWRTTWEMHSKEYKPW
ncbi:hypothetical protein C8R44DRAFT_244515 [Mycena epipterygia]|nr:hypothetical protein C8R44DRAFT_244515 [Mycena epipterygia]